jgi:hypothetical protein
MSKAIFAFDFSCNKPAMTSYINGVINFYVWPSEIDDKSYDRLTSCDVIVHNRKLEKIKEKSLDQHELILEHTHRAIDLSNIILDLIDYLVHKNNIDKDDVIIANEGFAFSAKGDAALQLAGYKYILMERLIDRGYKNLKTYSPITIKKTAGCSKKGLGKDAMIEAMSRQDDDHHLISILKNDPDYLKKKSNYVLCMDDIADSYWNLKTCISDVSN